MSLRKNQRYFFAIDLDGTLLADSATSFINNKTVQAIKKLQAQGHIVSLVTGRPWSGTKKAYETLGLKTIVVNYNGAHIHNPSDYTFIHHLSHMNLTDVFYILGDKKIQKAMSNFAIEGPSWVQIKKRDKALERVFGFDHRPKFRVGINIHKLPLKPTGVIFDTKPGIDVHKLQEYLTRRYGDLAEFSSWSKGKDLTPVFDMVNIGTSKGKAISLLSRYYDVDLKNTIAIGDGYNDLPMFEAAEISVAMKNSNFDIRNVALHTTIKTNKEGGVGEFIERFLNDYDGSFMKRLRKTKAKRTLSSKTTVSTF